MTGVAGIGPLPAAQGMLARGVSGKLAVPVRPSAEIYAHFRHVVGVEAPGDARAVPLYKLKILDNLIQSYLDVRKPQGLESREIQVPVDAGTVDTTIAALAADLREALDGAGAYTAGRPAAATGRLLSLGA